MWIWMHLSNKIKRKNIDIIGTGLVYILYSLQGRDDRRGGRRLIGRGQGASRVPGKFNRDRQDRRRPINKDRKGSRDHSDKPRRLNRFNDRNRRGDRPKQSEGKREQENKSK